MSPFIYEETQQMRQAAPADAKAVPTCGYCRDCKWWTAPLCPESDPYGGCEVIDDSADGNNALAVIHGYDGFDGGELWTKPDFGCVQFEPKEQV